MDHFVALLALRLHHELANEGIVLDDEYSPVCIAPKVTSPRSRVAREHLPV
jgi:hypothetical protein